MLLRRNYFRLLRFKYNCQNSTIQFILYSEFIYLFIHFLVLIELVHLQTLLITDNINIYKIW